MHGRNVTFWSPNEQDVPHYPGLPPCDLNTSAFPNFICRDGTYGRFEPGLFTQTWQPRHRWMPFLPSPYFQDKLFGFSHPFALWNSVGGGDNGYWSEAGLDRLISVRDYYILHISNLSIPQRAWDYIWQSSFPCISPSTALPLLGPCKRHDTSKTIMEAWRSATNVVGLYYWMEAAVKYAIAASDNEDTVDITGSVNKIAWPIYIGVWANSCDAETLLFLRHARVGMWFCETANGTEVSPWSTGKPQFVASINKLSLIFLSFPALSRSCAHTKSE